MSVAPPGELLGEGSTWSAAPSSTSTRSSSMARRSSTEADANWARSPTDGPTRRPGRRPGPWSAWPRWCRRRPATRRPGRSRRDASTGSSVTVTSRTRLTRNVRIPASVPATRYQATPFSHEAQRVHRALGLRSAAVGVGQADLHAVDHGLLQHVEVLRAGATTVPPQPAGSRTMADAAASASARNVSGSAWTSLRSAALASGVAVDDGPAIMNSVRASGRGEPAEVRAGAADQGPPAALAGLGVHGDAGDGQRLEVAAGRLDRHLQLVGELGGGDPTLGLQHQQGGHQAVGTHAVSFAAEVDTR